jgi:WD40 repeat protein
MVYAASSMRERYPHKVELWDVIEGQKVNTFDYLAKNIRDVFFTPNNKFVGLIIKDAIHILNISTGRIAKEIKGDFTDVLLDNSGKFLIAKEGKLNNQEVTLRDFEKGNIKKSFMSQLPSVSSIAFSKDGNFLYTANSEGSVYQWELSRGNMSIDIKGDKSYKTKVILSHYGKKLIYGGVENSIKVIDTNTGKEIKSLSPFPDKYSSSINSVRLSPDGNLLAIQNSDKQLTVVSLKEDAENMVFENEYPINAVSISPDNKYLFAGGSNDFLNIYNIETQELKKSLGGSNTLAYYLGYDNSITSIAIRPDSKYAAIANTNSIKLYNIRTEKIEKQYTVSELIQTMAFVNENYLLAGNYNGVLKLFNLFTGETIMALKGHSAAIEQIAINPVGSMAVTLSSDDSLCLWDIRQGQVLSKFASYDNSEWVFLTPEGYFNASSGGSKFINIRVSPTKVTGIEGEQLTKYFKPGAVVQKLN